MTPAPVASASTPASVPQIASPRPAPAGAGDTVPSYDSNWNELGENDGIAYKRPSPLVCKPASCVASFRVVVDMTVDTDGTVSSAKTIEGNRGVGACVEKVLRKWTYPNANSVRTVRVPVDFKC